MVRAETVFMLTLADLHLADVSLCSLSAAVSANEILALQTCHRQRSFLKFFGGCNAVRRALDVCLKTDKDNRREANKTRSGWAEKSEQLRRMTEERLSQKEQQQREEQQHAGR